jgi:hypothetical protein
LRDVAPTMPWMHDESLQSLDTVVGLYDRGGIDNPEKSALIAPRGLTGLERAALVAFLRAVTGSTVATLAVDVRAARRPPKCHDVDAENARLVTVAGADLRSACRGSVPFGVIIESLPFIARRPLPGTPSRRPAGPRCCS